jgi:hypothetical protein
MAAHLSAGSGVEHAERNSGVDELRFVQMWLLGESGAPAYRTGGRGVQLHDAWFDVLPVDGDAAVQAAPLGYVFVANGQVQLGDAALGPGDEARITEDTAMLHGRGELLVWRLGRS